MDKNQPGILSKAEVELLRNTFGGDGGTEVLYVLRNILLQFPTKEYKPFGVDLMKVLKKFILPELSPDLPIKSQSDLYFSLDNLKQIPPEIGFVHIKAMDKMVDFIEQRFDVLCGETEENKMLLTDFKKREDKTDEERFIDTVAFQSIVAYLETSCDRLRTIANAKEETEEEKEAKQWANSNK